MSETTPARQLVSIKEAAEHLGVCTTTLRRRIADGTITAYRLGPRLTRLDLAEAERELLRPIPTTRGGVE